MHHLLYFLGKRPPRSVVFLALLLAMLSWQPIFAASPPRMEKVTIGLPGANGTRFRTGQWAPVYVRLKASEEGNPQSQYELVLESTDFEEALYRYKVPVPSLRPKQEYTLLSYVHPGDETSEYSAWLQTVEGEKVQRLSKLRARIPGEEEVVAPRQVLFLAVGHKLSGLQKALNELDREEDKKGADGPKQPQMNNPRSEERRNRLAYIEEVNDLPDQWFGYEAVDVLVLCTAPSFLGPLVDEPRMESRRTALLEWVRRGGRLVLSVGKNTNGVTKLLSELRFLDCKINGSTRRDALPKFSRWSGAQQTLRTRDPFTIARLQPGSDVRVLLRESVSSLDSGERPMLVQGSCGLGRVLIVALDLDSPPFTEWRGSLDFWKRLHAQLVPRSPAPGGNQGTRGVEELGAQLKRQMETFPSIPVLSFGWVALFMLVYIVIVGPLDYLILKKLFKRLELTWITFPVLVITISLLAFFTAYFLKGDKILINKVDLVEYDYHNPERVYGTTWVTLFSPRMQTYTVGLEPCWPRWSDKPSGTGMPTLSILEGSGGNYRTQSQSLFRQPYHYAEDATGLVGVPIPVWSTQSFLGSWNARVPKNLLTVAEGNKELVRPVDVDLKKGRGGGGDALTGKIDNHLPVTLEGLCLFYRGKWYALNQSLGPGERYRVNIQFQGGGKGKAFADWFSPITSRELLWSTPTNAPLRPKMLAHPTVQNITEKADLPYSAFREIKALMFYEVWGNQKKWANSRLRNLDQSWRIEKQVDLQRKASYRDEAILVARTTLYDDRAEKITSESAAGTRLWLKKLPGGEEENTRPELPGKMSQETYIRVYIPVK